MPAASEADGVIQYARANNVTHIVIAAPRGPRWAELFRPAWRRRSSAAAGDISVHVVPEQRRRGQDDAAPPQPRYRRCDPRVLCRQPG